MLAAYSGSGTVTGVQWYYSGGKTGTNLIIVPSICSIAGSVPSGYPDASRMSFSCPVTGALPANTFKLSLTGLTENELASSWGATFYLSVGASPSIFQSRLPLCAIIG